MKQGCEILSDDSGRAYDEGSFTGQDVSCGSGASFGIHRLELGITGLIWKLWTYVAISRTYGGITILRVC
jgi:hypothetical protein